MNSSTKFNRENIIDEYREMISYFEEETDDETVIKLQKLDPTSRNIMILFIACNYRYGILSRMLCTNIAYAKKMIDNIRNKIIEMEI